MNLAALPVMRSLSHTFKTEQIQETECVCVCVYEVLLKQY